MKTLRKTLSLVLAVVMVMSLVVFASAEETGVDNLADYKDKDAAKASEYAEAIDLNIGLGIIKGMSATEIGINGNLTRAQAAKITAYVALGEDVAEALAAGETGFSDVPASHWASKFISYCVFEGWIQGYGNGKFGPDDQLTGLAFAKMLLNARGLGLVVYADPQTGLPKTMNEYTGTYWYVGVSRDANRPGVMLFDGINSATNLSGPITRAEAMQMVFNQVAVAGASAAYPVTRMALSTGTDAYDRGSHVWSIGGEAVTEAYVDQAKYVYKCAAAGVTYGDVLDDYNDEKGTELTLSGAAAATVIPVGTVVEFTTTKTNLVYYISYTYELDEITGIAEKAETSGAKKGYKAIDLKIAGAKAVYTDELSGINKGDIIAIPVPNDGAEAGNRIYADAVVLEATKGSAATYNGTKGYITVGGKTIYADANYTAAITSGEAVGTVIKNDFKTVFNYYLNPETGSLLGAVKDTGEVAEAYTTEYAYILDMQSRAYSDTSSTDLLGQKSGSTKTAAAVLKVVTTAGEVKTLNLAIANKGTNAAPDYQYVGTDKINPFANAGAAGLKVTTIAAGADGNIGKIALYHTNDDGTIVVTAVVAKATVTTTKAGVNFTAPAGKYGTSSTEITVVTIKTAGKAYTVSKITGYKNFEAATYNTAYVVYEKDKNGLDTNYVSKVFAFEQPGAGPAAPAVTKVAYLKAIGDESKDGIEYTFVIEGQTVKYFKDGDTDVSAINPVKGDYVLVTLNSDGKTINKFTVAPAADLASAKIDRLDEGNYIQSGATIVEFGKKTVSVYDLTGKGLTLAQGQTVTVFHDDSNVVVFIEKAA